jgi:polyvinyl alcohol dehydrogenase (cytochrome)
MPMAARLAFLAAPIAAAVTFAAQTPARTGEAIYNAQCATCHDKPDSRAPSRDTLKLKTRTSVLAALVSGSMSVTAKDLSAEEKRLVAGYVGGAEESPSSLPDTALCGARAPRFDVSSGAAWMGWGADPENTRFQPAARAGLSAEDVPKLRLKWAFGFPGGTTLAYAQPAVAGGRVFVGSDKGVVYALDAATGCAHWSFAAPAGVRSGIVVASIRLPGSSEPKPVAYFGDLAANVHALDAVTGAALWRVKVDDHRFARVTGTPSLEGGRLFVPVSSVEEVSGARPNYECCTFRGSVVALDAASGKTIWKTYIIPDEPKPVRKNDAGTQLWGPAGAAVWNAPTVDRRRGVLYVGTGNAYTAPAAATSDAIVAIEMDSGRMRWAKQLTPNDTFVIGCGSGNMNCPSAGPDHDFGTSPILRTVGGRSVVIAGQKSGVAFALDPDKEGAVIWQFRAGKGGPLGGIEWGMAADEELVFLPVSDVLPGEGGLRGGGGATQAGGLFGVRLATGERVWHTPAPTLTCAGGRGCSGAQSAAVTAMPGIVFSGSIDGHLRAFSTRDGAIVWDFDTAREFDTVNRVKANGGSLDAAGPAIAGGMVFTNSGYGQWLGKPGNVLLAFGRD